MNRRDIIAGAGALAVAAAVTAGAATDAFRSKRPPVGARCFTSKAVEAEIRAVKARFADPELAWMFENCYPNTLDTTVKLSMIDGKPDAFVITGDIDALWLRDSLSHSYGTLSSRLIPLKVL